MAELVYRWPFAGRKKVTLEYGVPGSSWKCGWHSGLDIISKAVGGTGEVRPIADGTVSTCITGHKSYGNYVLVSHPDGIVSLYAHMERILVNPGQQVWESYVLGIEGETGNASGRHLHLEIHRGGYSYPASINPREWLESHGAPFDEKEVSEVSGRNSIYGKLPKIHAVKIWPERWKIVKWGKGKRTTAIRDYCCFPFQASGTVPVGNIIADGVTLAKMPTASTIWLNAAGELGVGFSPPTGAKQAVSGFPLCLLEREYTLKEALAQGWDTSPLYPTTHAILGTNGEYLLYWVFETTSKGAEGTWTELQGIARMMGCHTVLLGDGGGSTILDNGGSNMIVSTGNRQLATLMRY